MVVDTPDTRPESLLHARLGRTQKIVLMLLANGSRSAQHMAYDHPALTESSARSAVMRLAQRGLADLAGWDDSEHRTYTLTEKGRELEASPDPQRGR